MQFKMSGKQTEVGAALSGHVEQAVSAMVGKYFGDAIEAHAVLSRESYLYCADLSVHIGRGITLQSSEKDADPYLAADRAVERIAKRMRRYKRRLRDHHNGGRDHRAEKASYLILAPEPEPEIEPAISPLAEPAEPQPVVVAEMTTEIATLSVGEAVMRLDLADAPALMFRNRAHGEFNVVYRRADGHIGWIDPKGG